MNISGSLLANYWRRKPVDDESKEERSAPAKTEMAIVEDAQQL
jgi:hypothetical protein